jgi:hypothetical protein
MRYGMIVEDPFYDEDGVLIDEDYDEAEWANAFPEPTEEEINKMLEEMQTYEPNNP